MPRRTNVWDGTGITDISASVQGPPAGDAAADTVGASVVDAGGSAGGGPLSGGGAPVSGVSTPGDGDSVVGVGDGLDLGVAPELPDPLHE
jgi:hypothetical protein